MYKMNPCADKGFLREPLTKKKKSVWSSTSLPDESSLWKLLRIYKKKRPEFDLMTDHSDQATQNGQKKPTFK